MTVGYKVVSLIRCIILIVIGALPMLLLGISIYTKAFLGIVIVGVVVFCLVHFSSNPKKPDQDLSEKCPYKVEV